MNLLLRRPILLTDALALMLKEALVGYKVLLPACVLFVFLSKISALPGDAVEPLNEVELPNLTKLAPTSRDEHKLIQR
jgi:hypothetical protein